MAYWLWGGVVGTLSQQSRSGSLVCASYGRAIILEAYERGFALPVTPFPSLLLSLSFSLFMYVYVYMAVMGSTPLTNDRGNDRVQVRIGRS